MNTVKPPTPRDFMPGECTGAGAEVFAMIDQRQGEAGPQIMAGMSICRNSCPQLNSCKEQREEITKILGARGVGRTVVGGNIIDPSKPEDKYAAWLLEPTIKFDLTHAPPRLETVRQGLRTGQLSLRGLQAASHASLTGHLTGQLSAANQGAMLAEKGIEAASVSGFVATALVRYAIARRPKDRSFKRNASLNNDELLEAETFQCLLAEDILALEAAGAHNPLDIAKYHKPELFLAVLEKYKSGFELTPGEIRRIFYESSFRPIHAIAKLLAKKREFKAAKDAGRPITKGEVVPLEVSESAHVASKLALLKRGDASIRKLTNLPHMKKYTTLIIRNNSANPAEELHALNDRVKTLKKKHTDIDIQVLAYIAYYHSENPDTAVGTFRDTLAELDRIHGGNCDLSNKLRQRLAYEHMADAPDVAKTYLERLQQVRELCKVSSLDISNNFKKQYALEFVRPIVAEEIAKSYQEFQLTFNRDRKFKNTPTWLREKIVELYDAQDQVQVARNAAIFVRRQYLQVSYVPELPEEELPYNRFDNKKGAYLAWSEDFTYLKPEEQEAILCAFGLDRLVLGRDADEAALKEHCRTIDLLAYIDDYLLPHTVFMSRNSREPEAVLENLRQAIRDHPNKGNQGKLKEEEQAQLDELYDQLMDKLTEEPPYGHDFTNEEVQRRLKMLVRRVMVFAPRVMHDRNSLLRLTKEFLHQASAISDVGIRDPYRVALGYSSKFCYDFMERSQRELPDHAASSRSEFIWRTTTGQVVPHFRRYQSVLASTKQSFLERRIPSWYHREACRSSMFTPQGIALMLKSYDDTRKHFARDPKVGSDVIRYYCFIRTGNPIKETKNWRTAMENIHAHHMGRIGARYIKRAALSRRGKKLNAHLDDCLEKFDTYCAYYKQNPHPAVNETVIHHSFFIARTGDPDAWLSEYIERWQDLHDTEDVTDIDPAILQRIVAAHKSDTSYAVDGYRRLRAQYLDDPYIEQPMIAEAIQYGVGKAFISLHNMRKLMAASHIRLDEVRAFKTGSRAGSMSTHEIIGDNAPSAHEQLFGPDDQEAQEQKQARTKATIGKFFETAPVMERAAFSIAYDIPWLMPSDMDEGDEDKVYAFYQVESQQELKERVDMILTGKT